jgi:hypothetical protein
MAPDCGANKEALMLLIVSAFPRLLRNFGPMALQDCHNAVGTVFAVGFQSYFLAAGGPAGSLK